MFLQSYVSNLNRDQIIFISTIVIPNIKTRNENNGFNGFVLPRHVVKSIKFVKGEDELFDIYIARTKLDPSTNAVYDSSGILIENANGKKGVYPETKNYNAWLNKCKEWTGSQWKRKGSNLFFPYDDNTKTEELNAIIDEWFNIEKHPDNCFSRYGITPDSPLIIGLCNGAYNDPDTGLKFNVNSAVSLLGGTDENTAGGWLGYTKGNGALSGLDEMLNYIRTSYMAKSNPPPQQERKRKRDCGLQTMTDGVMAGISTGMMGAFIQPPGAGAAVAAAGFGLGFFGGISGKCIFNK